MRHLATAALVSLIMASGLVQSAEFDPAAIDPAAAGMNPQRLAAIRTRMQEFVDTGKAAGFVTLVARHGHVASFEAVGFADLENQTPMKPDTLFAIMSITKPMTSVGIMILADEGKLSIVDPVEKHLPEFKGLKVATGGAETAGHYNRTVDPQRPITIRDVMMHTSGLRGSAPKGEYKTLAEMIEAGVKLPLLFEPGARWSYSSYGTAVLGRVIEVVSGKSYEEFMRERLFEPLGMKDSAFKVPDDQEHRLAKVYIPGDDGKLRATVPDNYPGKAAFGHPGGGLFSTAADVARFYQMMLNRGTLNGNRVLSPAAVELMTMSHTGEMPSGWSAGVGFGLGWAVVRDSRGAARYSSIGSYGHAGAYRTYAWVDPAKDLIGVILYQRNTGSDESEEINAFMQMSAAAIDN